MSASKFSASLTILLGVSAIVLPQLFGTAAVMILAAVMLASGLVALLFVNAARREGFPVSVLGPWARIVAGVVLMIWPGLALWLVAVVLGGGLILSGILGLSAIANSPVVNPAENEKDRVLGKYRPGCVADRNGCGGFGPAARIHPWRFADRYRAATVAGGQGLDKPGTKCSVR